MLTKYSPSTGYFYDTDIIYDPPMPSDVIDVDPDTAMQAVEAKNSGGNLSVEDGELVIHLAPQSTAEQLLSQARQYRLSNLQNACQGNINGGFQSSALGGGYTYPSTPEDRQNQMAVAQASSGGSLWCKPEGGSWSLIAHTQAQAQKVVSDFVIFMNSRQSKLVELQEKIRQAPTLEDVQGVTW